MKKNILITGGTGYIGSKVLKGLVNCKEVSTLISLDVREALHPIEKVKYEVGDIRSSEVTKLFIKHKINCVVHLASIVTPGGKKSRDFEYSVDVEGTKNILQCCVKAKVKQVIVTSSGAAYGYYKDNPEWLVEDDAIRGNYEFAYSYHKRLVEEMLASYRLKEPQLKQLILRPGAVFGANVSNQITKLFDKKFVIGIRGSDSPFVFIWDEDLVNIIKMGILEQKSGVYNAAGSGKLTITEIATRLNKPLIKLPASFIKAVLFVTNTLGLSKYGPEQVNFLRYRPVLDNKKLIDDFGYLPKKTSSEVFDYYLKMLDSVSS